MSYKISHPKYYYNILNYDFLVVVAVIAVKITTRLTNYWCHSGNKKIKFFFFLVDIEDINN